MDTFVYLLRPTRPELARTPSQDEMRVLDAHFARLKEALSDGLLILAGPCLDAAFGIVVFRATSQAEAAAFMESDPAVSEGLMTATLHPFRVSLLEKTRAGPHDAQVESEVA